MINNKWLHGDVTLILPNLHPQIVSSLGLKAIPMILNPDVGEEVVLLVIESPENLGDFKGREKMRFEIKTGLVNTKYGPVMFLLYIIPDPINGNDVVYENSINPTNLNHIAPFRKLSNQQFWHMVVLDPTSTVHNFFEFKNEYNLALTLNQVEDTVKDMPVHDFLAAKAEYESKYSVEYLLTL